MLAHRSKYGLTDGLDLRNMRRRGFERLCDLVSLPRPARRGIFLSVLAEKYQIGYCANGKLVV